MSEIKLVQVDTFFDGLAAHQAKNWLEQEGINAFVEGANANSAMYIGSALSGVKLLVALEDEDIARILLKQYHNERPTCSTWYCGQCEEFNEPSFDLCWSCGRIREEVEVPAPVKNANRSSNTSIDELGNLDIPERVESGNPYQPPMVMLPAIHRRDEHPESGLTQSTEQAEEDIRRAWRASILGLLIPIPLLQLYSVILLLGVDRSTQIGGKSKRQLKWAWSINIAMGLLFCFVIRACVIR